MIVTEEPRQATTDLPDLKTLVAEALIKEARQRQRRRWLSIVAAALVLAIGGVALAPRFATSAKGTVARSATDAATATATCLPTHVKAKLGPEISPATGEHAITIALVNQGSSPCVLKGYPRVHLATSSLAALSLPQVTHDQYVRQTTPRQVRLRPGATGYVLVAKYRCDIGNLQVASGVRLRLPGYEPSTALYIPVSYPQLALCKGGPADPGNVLAVSPVVSTLASILP